MKLHSAAIALLLSSAGLQANAQAMLRVAKPKNSDTPTTDPLANLRAETMNQVTVTGAGGEAEAGARRLVGQASTAPITDVKIWHDWNCPTGYEPAPTSTMLNGDLNQSAGGKDIILCLSRTGSGSPITNIKLQQRRNCGAGWSLAPKSGRLNGDLNQSAGGKDIFMCFTTDTTKGEPIVTIGLETYPAPRERRPMRPDGLNGDLNQNAGGKDIFMHLWRAQSIVDNIQKNPLYISNSWRCHPGFSLVLTSPDLNGDVNQGAGGRDIFICSSLQHPEQTKKLTGMKLQQTIDCGFFQGWTPVSKTPGLNGDLNQAAGGKDLYLCYSEDASHGEPIENVYLTEYEPGSAAALQRPDGLNGDLNQNAGGKDIFMALLRQSLITDVPAADSYPASSTFHFGSGCDFSSSYCPIRVPEPGYSFVSVLNTNLGPCFHAQQVVTFADSDTLYTFFTQSQSTHGKAYMMKTPLKSTTHASLPAIEDATEVQWYEQTTGFNHPGDLVISDKIILSAGENHDPTWPLPKAIGDVAGCGYRLASDQQALIIWDFRDSLTHPAKYVIEKSEFDSITETPMDDTRANDLKGGNVNGELIIQFEEKWLRWKGEHLGSASGWEEIKVSLSRCSSVPGGLAGDMFTTINGQAYRATFSLSGSSYQLTPIQFIDGELTANCNENRVISTAPGTFVDVGGDGETRAFQTITQAPNGKVYMTSVDIRGEKIMVMASGDHGASACVDTADWKDFYHHGCDWYEKLEFCPHHGNHYDGGMGLPKDNCCYCMV